MTATRSHYSTVAIVLHWAIAAAIVFQVILGWRMTDAPRGPAAFAMFQLHKSIGITILLLSVARLGWRVANPPPVLANQARWEKIASQVVHAAFYVMLIGLPLTGWAVVSTSRIDVPTLLYGAIAWPHLPWLADLAPAAKAGWHDATEFAHATLVRLTVALLFLHLGAVAKHQLLDRDPVFSHMAPGARHGWAEPRLWLILLGLAGLMAVANAYVPAIKAAAPPVVASVERPSPEPAAVAEPLAAAVQADNAAEAVAEPKNSPVPWKVRSGGSLAFTASWSGAAIDGQFRRWDADIRFAPDALADSTLRVSVDLASASTGDAQQDASLPSADWFDVASHPKAVFAASDFRKLGGDRYEARGTLTLKGVSRPTSVRFGLTIKGDTATANGTATVDRTSFGVGQGEWAATDQIGADVKVRFALTAAR